MRDPKTIATNARWGNGDSFQTQTHTKILKEKKNILDKNSEQIEQNERTKIKNKII